MADSIEVADEIGEKFAKGVMNLGVESAKALKRVFDDFARDRKERGKKNPYAESDGRLKEYFKNEVEQLKQDFGAGNSGEIEEESIDPANPGGSPSKRNMLAASRRDGKACVFAQDKERAELLWDAIGKAGIEGCTVHPPQKSTYDMWEIRIPQGELSKASRDLKGLLRMHTRSAALKEKALDGALDKLERDGSLPATGEIEYSGEKRSFDFKTLSFDPNADFMRKRLKKANIPFDAAQIDGAVRFTVPAESAPLVKSIADGMANPQSGKNVKNMSGERFVFQKGFDAPVAGSAAESAAAHVYTCDISAREADLFSSVLLSENIPFTSSQKSPGEPFKFTLMPESEQSLKNARAQLAELKDKTPQEIEKLLGKQRAYEKGNPLSPADKTKAARALENSGKEKHKGLEKLERDCKEKTELAERLASKTPTTKRTRSQSKGGI